MRWSLLRPDQVPELPDVEVTPGVQRPAHLSHLLGSGQDPDVGGSLVLGPRDGEEKGTLILIVWLIQGSNAPGGPAVWWRVGVEQTEDGHLIPRQVGLVTGQGAHQELATVQRGAPLEDLLEVGVGWPLAQAQGLDLRGEGEELGVLQHQLANQLRRGQLGVYTAGADYIFRLIKWVTC